MTQRRTVDDFADLARENIRAKIRTHLGQIWAFSIRLVIEAQRTDPSPVDRLMAESARRCAVAFAEELVHLRRYINPTVPS